MNKPFLFPDSSLTHVSTDFKLGPSTDDFRTGSNAIASLPFSSGAGLHSCTQQSASLTACAEVCMSGMLGSALVTASV